MRRRFNRKSVRILGYDYSQPGWYFVTIGVQNHECIFGEIKNTIMHLNETGKIAHQYWREIPDHFPHARIDKFIIMPNHVHGIIQIPYARHFYIGARHAVPLYKNEKFGKPVAGSIPTIVRSYKSAVTKSINEKNNTPGERVWQRNYYLSFINDHTDLYHIRQYIQQNPARWEEKNAA